MQKMQDKETLEGAKQYLQSFFRNPQLEHSEFNERKNLLSALLSSWAQKDAMRLFYDVLFWSIQTESEHPKCFWYVQLWQVNNFPIRVIKFAGEPKARLYNHNMHFEQFDWGQPETNPVDFKGEIFEEEISGAFQFGFYWWQTRIEPCKNKEMTGFTGVFNFQPFQDVELPDCLWCDDAGGYDVAWGEFLEELPYVQKDKKALFKGQKYFLMAVRYFFRVFYPQNIPTLRQIKKYMLKNDLINPLPTFWVK
jgi:hypothetical protein